MVDPKSELTRVMEKYNAAFFSKDRTNSSTSIYKEYLMSITHDIDAQAALDIFEYYKFSSQPDAGSENATYLFENKKSTIPKVFTITGGRLSITQEGCRDELARLKQELTTLKNSRSQTPTR